MLIGHPYMCGGCALSSCWPHISDFLDQPLSGLTKFKVYSVPVKEGPLGPKEVFNITTWVLFSEEARFTGQNKSPRSIVLQTCSLIKFTGIW